MHLKSRFTCINVLFLFILLILAAQSRQPRGDKKRDAEENEHHLLHILKDHEIIPDIIDDAAHADVLEVRIFINQYISFSTLCEVFFFSSKSVLLQSKRCFLFNIFCKCVFFCSKSKGYLCRRGIS